MTLNRQDSLNLMHAWVSSESLRKHMYCVEEVLRQYAIKFNQDQELWRITGLLHDFDYEKYPNFNETEKQGHPFEGVRELVKLNYPSELTEAILGHALYSGVKRESLLAKTLFASDEICGFVMACAYMRPDKLQTLDAGSVKKKLKSKNFAAKVSREDIALGIKEMEVNEDEHITFVISALKGISKELGF